MMMENNLELTMSGSTDDIKKMMEVINLYTKRDKREHYFDSVLVNGKIIDLDNLTDEEVKKLCTKREKKVNITADGPLVGFFDIIEVDYFFRELAEVAPKAFFQGEINSYYTYGIQVLSCELRDGMLNISEYYEDEERKGLVRDEYAKYIVKKLPFEQFKKLFKLSGEEDEEVYVDNLARYMDVCFEDPWSFFDILQDEEFETELDRDEFVKVVENKLKPLGIQPIDEYACSHGYEKIKGTNQYVYDPVTKEYIGDNKPPKG